MNLTPPLVAAAVLALGAGAAAAEPAIIYDLGGKFDKSFNEAAFRGASRWADETGGDFREIEITAEAQREQALRRLADIGANPVVMTGFSFKPVLEEVAPDYPDTNFAVVDTVVDEPNVRSVTFKDHEGSFLVGIMAAMASKTGKVGFVGGMDVPLIRNFRCGYRQGVKYADKDAEVLSNMTGTTPAAWNDPVKGGELTKGEIADGADVIFAAAGSTGLGVLQAAADAGKLAIGVDSNQDHLHPGNMLTSMLKRTDVAVYNAFKDGTDGDGEFETGHRALGVAENGVGPAFDKYNKDLVTDAMKKAVDAAKEKIVSGEIEVDDYASGDTCDVAGS